MSVGTYPGPCDDGPNVAYHRATVDGPGPPSLAGVHGSTTASYGPGTGSAYYPVGTGTAARGNFPGEPENPQRHQDTGAGQHQTSSCSVLDVLPSSRRHPMVSSRYAGDGLMYPPCGPHQQLQQQQHHAQMMAAADPNFVCSVWTPDSGYASYVHMVDQRTGATIPRSVCHALSSDLRDRPIALRYRPIALRIRRIRR